MMVALLLLFYFLVPVALLRAAKRFSWIDKIGVVTLCYVAGIVFGNIPGVAVPMGFAEEFMGIVVALSIPMLLFSSNIRVWRKLGPQLLLSFFGCVLSVCIAAVIGTWLFQGMMHEAWKSAAMLIGVYIGTTANMNAVGIALGVDHESFALINGVEMLFGGAYLLLLLSIAKPLFAKVLKTKTHHEVDVAFSVDEKVYWKTTPIALLLSIFFLAASFGLSKLIISDPENEQGMQRVILLSITTLGLIGSAIPRIHNLKGSFGMGNYLMYVFCVAVGSLASVSKIFGAAPAFLGFVLAILVISVLLHCLYCKILGIDTDTFLIASTAGIQGPAFIAPVTKAIGHQSLIPVGIALALIGLALGNYIGIGMSYLLRHI